VTEVRTTSWHMRAIQRCNNRRVHSAPSYLYKSGVFTTSQLREFSTGLKMASVNAPIRRIRQRLLITVVHAALARYRPGDFPFKVSRAHHVGRVFRNDRKARQVIPRSSIARSANVGRSPWGAVCSWCPQARALLESPERAQAAASGRSQSTVALTVCRPSRSVFAHSNSPRRRLRGLGKPQPPG
jgi:hypothetical protein